MPASSLSHRSPNYIPKPTKHASGQAVVRLNDKDVYLGKWGAPSTDAKYDRVILEWLANGRQMDEKDDARTIEDLVLAFWRHAQKHYRHPDGRQTSELHCMQAALRQLKHLYGDMDADAFGPSELRIIRDSMVKLGWARKAINAHLSRLKHVFRWAGEHGIVMPEVYHRLLCVRGLQAGRSDAKETAPIKPVAEHVVRATLPHVSRQVAAMIQLQMISGMRSGEVTIMRACDLETSGHVWVYRPQFHKTQWHGHKREVFLGPQCQEIIKPFLKTELTAYLFSPAEAEAERMIELRQKRKSKVQPSQLCRKVKKPQHQPGEHYTTESYGRAIRRACEDAFPLPPELDRRLLEHGRRETHREHQARLTADDKASIKAWRREHNWHPHQLRHTAGTRIRKEHGIELTRILLGHRTAFTTELYAEVDKQQAIEVMLKTG